MKFKTLVALAALMPTIAVAQVVPPAGRGVDPTTKAIDDAQRPDKHIGTTEVSPPATAAGQPSPTTDPSADPLRSGASLQGQPHGRGGVAKTIPVN